MAEKVNNEQIGPSRSAQKRAARDVEDLAQQLVALPEAELKRLPASEEIAEELRNARRTGGRSAHRRQIKYLAGLLRRQEEEVARIRAFLAGVDEQSLEEKREFHGLEKLRERLCSADTFAEALTEVKKTCPSLDPERLTRLARAVQTGGDRRAFREIFRLLRQARP